MVMDSDIWNDLQLAYTKVGWASMMAIPVAEYAANLKDCRTPAPLLRVSVPQDVGEVWGELLWRVHKALYRDKSWDWQSP